MRLLLFSMQDLPLDAESIFAPAGKDRFRLMEITQAMALASHMRDGGSLAPLVVCRRQSLTQRIADELNFPSLVFDRGRDAAAAFRLWQWQKKHAHVLALLNGAESLGMGRLLAFMRKKESVAMIPVFFGQPPALEKKDRKFLLKTAQCICGSSFVAQKLAEQLEAGIKEGQKTPEMPECAPGLDLGKFSWPAREYTAEDAAGGRHFVFGMAESMSPRSGALLTVRAMAALWQKDDLPPWEVRMFGTGPRYAEILAEAGNLGVMSRLSLLGDQWPEVACSGCHAWLAPGSSPDELPGTLWNGVAAGLPLICTSSPLHKERMADLDPHTALKVEKNNPQELARAMIGVMRDSRLRQRMAHAGEAGRFKTGVAYMAGQICDMLERWRQELWPEKDTER